MSCNRVPCYARYKIRPLSNTFCLVSIITGVSLKAAFYADKTDGQTFPRVSSSPREIT